MAKAIVRDYGKVEFDPMNYDNNFYDLWAVAICDPETDLIIGEEHYTNESDYRSALRNTYGREVMNEQMEFGSCDVDYDLRTYDCECMYHIAYVVDNDEEK